MFFKIDVLKKFRQFHIKTSALEFLYYKETPTQLFYSYEICKNLQ